MKHELTTTTKKFFAVTIFAYDKKDKGYVEIPNIEQRCQSEAEAIARMSEPLPEGQVWGAHIYTPKVNGACDMALAEVRDGHLVPVW